MYFLGLQLGVWLLLFFEVNFVKLSGVGSLHVSGRRLHLLCAGGCPHDNNNKNYKLARTAFWPLGLQLWIWLFLFSQVKLVKFSGVGSLYISGRQLSHSFAGGVFVVLSHIVARTAFWTLLPYLFLDCSTTW